MKLVYEKRYLDSSSVACCVVIGPHMHNISYWKHGLIMGSTKHYAYSECVCGIVNNSDVEGGRVHTTVSRFNNSHHSTTVSTNLSSTQKVLYFVTNSWLVGCPNCGKHGRIFQKFIDIHRWPPMYSIMNPYLGSRFVICIAFLKMGN